jgi:formamidopyrimidine-DNA glycosylase
MAIEFPEASIISRQMGEVLPGRRIEHVRLRDLNAAVIRWGFVNLHQVDISRQRVQAVRQFGDNIFIELEQHVLVTGDMIGKILFHPPETRPALKAAVVLELDNGAAVSYNPTLYGLFKAFTPEEAAKIIHPGWIQPFDDAFTAEYLARAFAEPERKVAKQMNIFNCNFKVCGVGNGYWQEVLYLSGVHPNRKAGQIRPAEYEAMQVHTLGVLRKALNAGGSQDESDFYGCLGGYQRVMGGHWKGQPCPTCGTIVQGKNLLGANVYFCPVCQS